MEQNVTYFQRNIHYGLQVMDHLLECWLLDLITLSWMKLLFEAGQLFLSLKKEIYFSFLNRQKQEFK